MLLLLNLSSSTTTAVPVAVAVTVHVAIVAIVAGAAGAAGAVDHVAVDHVAVDHVAVDAVASAFAVAVPSAWLLQLLLPLLLLSSKMRKVVLNVQSVSRFSNNAMQSRSSRKDSVR